ncbi:hypothetical protein Tco_1129575 [Tanacetum coccineum]
MAESLDEQQQQQKLQDVALVPVKDQELSTQKFYFQLEDQVIEVNADLLYTMAESLDEQQQQQKQQDAALVLVKDQVQIPMSNLIIALEKIQPYVIFNVTVPAHTEEVAKSTKTVPARVTCRGKGLLTKNGVEIAVEKVSIPKRKRTQIVTKKIGQSEEAVANEANSEATNEEEVEPLVRRRSTSLSIYQKTDQVSEVTKGLSEGSGAIPEVSDELAFKSLNEETRILPKVPDGSRDESSSSSSESELAVKDISSDDEEVSNKADKITKNVEEVAANADEVTEKADEVTEKAEDVVEKYDIVIENIKMTEVEKNTDVQVAEEQLHETQIGDKGLVATIKPATEAQDDAPMYVAQPENIS